MTATPIFDQLVSRGSTAGGAGSATAFGRGAVRGPEGPGVPAGVDLAAIVESARLEAVVHGQGRAGCEHLLLALVRTGGEVGRAFGLRGATVGRLAVACASATAGGDLVENDGRPGTSTVVAAMVRAAARNAALAGRGAPGPVDLALALLRSPRVAALLGAAGLAAADVADLADVLAAADGSPIRRTAAGPTAVEAAPAPVSVLPARAGRVPVRPAPWRASA